MHIGQQVRVTTRGGVLARVIKIVGQWSEVFTADGETLTVKVDQLEAV